MTKTRLSPMTRKALVDPPTWLPEAKNTASTGTTPSSEHEATKYATFGFGVEPLIELQVKVFGVSSRLAQMPVSRSPAWTVISWATFGAMRPQRLTVKAE